jgi:hypothetical protein
MCIQVRGSQKKEDCLPPPPPMDPYDMEPIKRNLTGVNVENTDGYFFKYSVCIVFLVFQSFKISEVIHALISCI